MALLFSLPILHIPISLFPPLRRFPAESETKFNLIGILLLFSSLLAAIVESSVLRISKISRLHMGSYLCVASNGIEPSTSKKYKIRVQCKIKKRGEGSPFLTVVTMKVKLRPFPSHAP